MAINVSCEEPEVIYALESAISHAALLFSWSILTGLGRLGILSKVKCSSPMLCGAMSQDTYKYLNWSTNQGSDDSVCSGIIHYVLSSLTEAEIVHRFRSCTPVAGMGEEYEVWHLNASVYSRGQTKGGHAGCGCLPLSSAESVYVLVFLLGNR